MGDIQRQDGKSDGGLAGLFEPCADEAEPERTLCVAEFALDFNAVNLINPCLLFVDKLLKKRWESFPTAFRLGKFTLK